MSHKTIEIHQNMAISHPTPGRLLLSLIALTTSIGCFIADFNKTHILNPNWPPHARFHNGQTMSMGLCLGLSTLYYTWRSNPNAAAEKDSLNVATWLASMYWVTQLSAILYPGSLGVDPEFGEGFPQFWLCTGMFCVIGGAYWLESRRMRGEGKKMQ
jgi:hypothetical protein